MSLDEKFIPIRTAIYEIIGNFFEKVAGLFVIGFEIQLQLIKDMEMD